MSFEFTQNHIFLTIGALAVAGVSLYYYLAYLRRQKLAGLAASMGLLYSEEGPDIGFLQGTGLELFCQGHTRSAINMIQASTPAGPLRVFDYSYVTGHGKHRSTHSYTVALIDCAQVKVPHFDLKPETFLYKIGEFMGFKDIDLPGFQIFSDKYRLTGADPAAVQVFFSPARAAWFERNLGMRVQGARDHVLVLKREGTLSVDAWQGLIEEVRAFAAEVLK